MRDILFVKFSNERNRKFRIKTEICRDNGKRFVIKSPADSAARAHILSMDNNYARLVDAYLSDRICINRGSLSGRGARWIGVSRTIWIPGAYLRLTETAQLIAPYKVSLSASW